MRKIKELYQKHGKKALIIWAIWMVTKWTLLILFGKAIFNYLG